jgi:ATP-dependent DNA helicase RecQ
MGGTTLAISPLIARMKDQVDALTRKGLRAAYLNSSLDEAERRRRIKDMLPGQLRIGVRSAGGDRVLHRIAAGAS